MKPETKKNQGTKIFQNWEGEEIMPNDLLVISRLGIQKRDFHYKFVEEMKRSKGLEKEEHYKLKKMGLDEIRSKDFHKKKEITKVRARVFIIFLFPLSSLDKRQTEC